MSVQLKSVANVSIKELLDTMTGCCVFCRRPSESVDSQIVGETRKEESISIHFFCMLLATDLFQRGTEQQGIHGFLLPDIKKRLLKVMNSRCSYCYKYGASITCAKRNCNRIFHYPCGYEHYAMANYNSDDFEVFCGDHRRIQDIVPLQDVDGKRSCVACLEEIVAEPTAFNILVSPCCRKSYHKECVRHYAVNAGRKNFKCCHCRNLTSFVRCVQENGIFIPELENHAEESLLDHHYRDFSICSVQSCVCPEGRQRVDNHPHWEIVLCDTCGDNGTHLKCSNLEDDELDYNCEECVRDLRQNDYRLLLEASPYLEGSSSDYRSGICSDGSLLKHDTLPDLQKLHMDNMLSSRSDVQHYSGTPEP